MTPKHAPSLENCAPPRQTCPCRSAASTASLHSEPSPTRQRGFTLIELMITISILAILLGVGVPSFTNIIQDNRSGALANDIVALLSLARSEAIRQGRHVEICPSSDQSTCVDTKNWHSEDSIIIRVENSNTQILRVFGTPSNASIVSGENRLVFTPLGAVRDTTTITTTFDGYPEKFDRRIEISLSGRIRSEIPKKDEPVAEAPEPDGEDT